jgi:hypothetical protein
MRGEGRKPFGREPEDRTMAPSRTASPPAVRAALPRALDGDHAVYLHDLWEELVEPPEFVLRVEPLPGFRAGRGRVIWDGVAVWLH